MIIQYCPESTKSLLANPILLSSDDNTDEDYDDNDSVRGSNTITKDWWLSGLVVGTDLYESSILQTRLTAIRILNHSALKLGIGWR